MIHLLLNLAIAQSMNMTPAPELEFQESWHINSSERFDFSGLILLSPLLRNKFGIQGDFLLANDKSPILWLGTQNKNLIDLRPWIDLSTFTKEKLDLEAIDTIDQKIYITHEADGMTFEIDQNASTSKPSVRVIRPPVDLRNFDSTYKITKQFGIESMTVSSDFIFLGKEMMPLGFFRIPRGDKKLTSNDIKILGRSAMGSQTDAKIRNQNFYVLDRDGRRVWKSSLEFKNEKIVSFSETLKRDQFNYRITDKTGVDHPEWGTAEAFDITENSIYVGLDNNGEGLRKHSGKDETRPVLIRFKRPKNF